MNVYAMAGACFGLVMLAMLGLGLLFGLLGRIGRATDQSAAEPVHDPQLIVLLTAAASEALRAPIRLYAVQLLVPKNAEVWSRAGRMDVMISHRVEPKR